MRAQGTIEYLVIIAVVVVVALIVVGLLVTLMDSGGDISGTSNQINYNTQTLALNDYIVSTDGNFLLEIKSNEVGNITIDNVSIDNEEQDFTTNNTINLGQERLIKIESSTTCEEGQTVTAQTITITYTSANGLTKKQIYENVSIPCQNYTNPNQTQLLGGTTTQSEEDASCDDYATTDGEDITDDGTYCTAVFLSDGTFTALTSFNAEVLVVAGGGGGGGPVHAGGGGAGGLVYDDSYSISPGEIEVVVGAGGAGGEGWNITTSPGENGSNSIFDSIEAIGGGGGAYWYQGASTAGIGGSGGGAAPEPEAATGAIGTDGQGYAGGGSYGSTNAGGGGGAGEAGEKAVSGKAGDGGDGVEYDISGESVYYAGGGGGGVHEGTATIGQGGLGGGGDGGGNTVGTANGNDGTANTGGGGGGAGGTSGSSYAGGAGGSGIVIIRYLK